MKLDTLAETMSASSTSISEMNKKVHERLNDNGSVAERIARIGENVEKMVKKQNEF